MYSLAAITGIWKTTRQHSAWCQGAQNRCVFNNTASVKEEHHYLNLEWWYCIGQLLACVARRSGSGHCNFRDWVSPASKLQYEPFWFWRSEVKDLNNDVEITLWTQKRSNCWVYFQTWQSHISPMRMNPIDYQSQGSKGPIRQVVNSLNEVANVCRKNAMDKG